MNQFTLPGRITGILVTKLNMKKIFVSVAVAAGLLVGGLAMAAAPAATTKTVSGMHATSMPMYRMMANTSTTSTPMMMRTGGMGSGMNSGFSRTGGMGYGVMPAHRIMGFGSNGVSGGARVLFIIVFVISVLLVWTILVLFIMALLQHLKKQRRQ